MRIHSYRYEDGAWSTPVSRVTDPERCLVLLFAAPCFAQQPQVLTDLINTLGPATIIGCSTSGEIHGDLVFDDSIVVAVCEFEHTRVQFSAVRTDEAASNTEVGRMLAANLNAKDLRSVFVLSDGLNVQGAQLAEGLRTSLDPQVVVTGGLAGDGSRFGSTWILVDGKPVDNHVAAAGLYGSHVHINHACRGGWDAFGVKRLITRSDNHVLFELDGEPALTLYKEYLGDLAADLPASGVLFPLMLQDPGGKRYLVRTPLAVDEDELSLSFAGDMPEGWTAQLMRANFDRLVEGAERAGEIANTGEDFIGDALQIAISCVGRRLVLGERVDEELEAALASTHDRTTQVGFYSYGELSPIADGGCELHNQTMTLTTIVERR